MAFVKQLKRGAGACIFCSQPKGRDEKHFILWRGERTFAMLNLFPYNPGHLMVAPFRHIAEYEDLTSEELAEMDAGVQRAIRLLKKVMKPDGLNVGLNLGTWSGAGFAHLHTHVVPRWGGDANFMPVIGDTKVIPEAIEATYRKLKKAMKEK